jgi:hypothetical protein
VSGRYALLHTYLEHRFADTVFLTFAQIEDIIGFPLPEQALMQPEWWTGATTGGSHHSDAWTLAKRSAAPTLGARTVSFQRAFVVGIPRRS